MKKVTKKLSVAALCVLMLIMSAVTAFAAAPDTSASINSSTVENHAIIDCTNRYKMDNGKFNFTIKVPHNTNLNDVTLEVTRDYNGTFLFSDRLFYFSVPEVWGTTLTLSYTYDGSDYYELITDKFVDAGIGIKLFMTYNGTRYMATDTANDSTTEGRGYWLGA